MSLPSNNARQERKSETEDKYSKPCLVEILYFCNIVQCL